MSNINHFVILFGMREKIACSELCVTPVLTQNPDIWNFYGSPTSNNGKITGYFRNPWYAIVSNMDQFFHSVWHEIKIAFFKLFVLPVLTQNEEI